MEPPKSSPLKPVASIFSMESREFKIVQASTRGLLFRRCTCGSYTVPVIMNDLVYGKETFYCERCTKIVTDFNVKYKLQLVVLDVCTNRLESIVAYDDVVANLIGCSQADYVEHLKRDKLLSKKLEEQLVGMYCSARMDARGRESYRKVKKIALVYADNFNLIDVIIANSQDEIRVDESLL